MTANPAATTGAAPAAPHTEADRERLQKRSLRILLASQVLSGAGLAAGLTVGALLAEDMLGTTSLSGLPAALSTFGSALAAMSVVALSDRRGRRSGLAAGYAAGAVGSAGVAVAAVLDSAPLLLLALLARSPLRRYRSGSCRTPAASAAAARAELAQGRDGVLDREGAST